jgi:tight adherence protein B
MNLFLIGAAIFIISVLVIEMIFLAYRTVRNPNRVNVRKRLRTFTPTENEDAPDSILRKRRLSDIPFLNKILLSVPGIQPLDMLLQQANVKYTIGSFLLTEGILALAGYLVSFIITGKSVTSAIIAAALIAAPFFYLHLKKRKRMEKFERQLPEGLELISRALRAGHALTGGIRLAADEFDDPLGPEFEKTLDEINFGISVTDALKNLAGRIDCPDLRYFIVSVILQRESGGNLAEIIDSIAYLVRERFKFRGKVQVLAAEGKLTAIILVALPFFVLIVLYFMNPAYLSVLFDEPAGRIVVGIALSMMVVGIIVIKKVINIKV